MYRFPQFKIFFKRIIRKNVKVQSGKYILYLSWNIIEKVLNTSFEYEKMRKENDNLSSSYSHNKLSFKKRITNIFLVF